MAILNVRNLPDDVHRLLRLRAARAGRSTEAEARAILTEVCRAESGSVAPKELQELVDQMFPEGKPSGQVDLLLAQRRAEAIAEQS